MPFYTGFMQNRFTNPEFLRERVQDLCPALSFYNSDANSCIYPVHSYCLSSPVACIHYTVVKNGHICNLKGRQNPVEYGDPSFKKSVTGFRMVSTITRVFSSSLKNAIYLSMETAVPARNVQ